MGIVMEGYTVEAAGTKVGVFCMTIDGGCAGKRCCVGCMNMGGATVEKVGIEVDAAACLPLEAAIWCKFLPEDFEAPALATFFPFASRFFPHVSAWSNAGGSLSPGKSSPGAPLLDVPSAATFLFHIWNVAFLRISLAFSMRPCRICSALGIVE
jgi:hypothetical protein